MFSFKKPMNKFCDLTCFGEIKVIQPIPHQNKPVFANPNKFLEDTELKQGSWDSDSEK